MLNLCWFAIYIVISVSLLLHSFSFFLTLLFSFSKFYIYYMKKKNNFYCIALEAAMFAR